MDWNDKEQVIEYKKRWYQKNKKRVKAKSKTFYKENTEHVNNRNIKNYWTRHEEKIDYNRKNADKCRKRSRKYRESNRELLRKRAINRRNDPSQKHKWNAREAAQKAKNKGILVSPSKCEGCKEKKPLSMHHDDYSKPLDVRWLCKKCHGIVHRLYD